MYNVGDMVKVIRIDLHKDFKDDRIGTIKHIDGYYNDIELNKSKVIIEAYPNEFEVLPNE